MLILIKSMKKNTAWKLIKATVIYKQYTNKTKVNTCTRGNRFFKKMKVPRASRVDKGGLFKSKTIKFHATWSIVPSRASTSKGATRRSPSPNLLLLKYPWSPIKRRRNPNTLSVNPSLHKTALKFHSIPARIHHKMRTTKAKKKNLKSWSKRRTWWRRSL